MPLSDRRPTDTTTSRRISVAIVATIALALLAAAPAPFSFVDAASNDAHADGGVGLSGLESVLPQLPTDAADRVSALRGSADRLRGAADRGRVGGVLGQVMHERGVDVAVPSPPAPTTVVELPQLAELSPALREPVAGLDAAVQQASALLGEVPLAQLNEMLRLEAEASGEWMDATAGFVSPEAGALTGEAAERRDQAMAAHTPWPEPPAELPPAIARAVANAPEAALLLAAAVDTHMPQLEAAAQAATKDLSADRSVEGCDLVATSDMGQGRLCVASEADNVHRKDYMLVIDLGGNDTYHNSAGGAPYVRTGSDLVAQVSLLVDLGGDDRYEPTGDLLGSTTARLLYYSTTGFTGTSILQARVASGAGIYGGVGMLVDRAGDDTYLTHVDSHGSGTWTAAYTQGSGRLGVGILIDDAGNDAYSATGGDGAGVVGVLAQASSHGPCYGGHTVRETQWSVNRGCDTGTVGLLVDRSGDDHYRIDAGTAEGSRHSEEASAQLYPVRQASGQASANGGGSALLLDGSGSDVFEVRSDGQGPVATTDERDGVFAFVNAQGSSGIGGRVWLLTGAGNTRYETHVTSAGRSLWQWVGAQGDGYSGSALLSDLGGDDRYEISVERSPRLMVEGDDCCTGHTQLVPAAALSVYGQGRGWLGGSGVLDDGTGNDAYVLTSETDLHVQIDGLVEEPDAFIDVLRWSNDLKGQGSASVDGALGALLDRTGTDNYRLVLREHAEVLAAIQGSEPRLRVLRPAALTGQGATDGFVPLSGVLQDLDGAGDRFDARLDFVVHTSPQPPYGFLQPGDTSGAIRVQGSGTGGVFVAAGDRPEVMSSPREPACGDPGVRGYGVWRERCGGDDPTAGVGFALDAAVPQGVRELEVTAAPVTLQDVDPETYEYDQAVPRTMVRAQLTDPTGGPVAGQKLHFALTQDVPTDTGRREGPEGNRRFYASATTNQDGVAWARIPVPLLTVHTTVGGHSPSTVEELGVLVLFDGVRADPATAADGGALPAQGWTRLEEP